MNMSFVHFTNFQLSNLAQNKAFEQSKCSISKPVDFTVNDDDGRSQLTWWPK